MTWIVSDWCFNLIWEAADEISVKEDTIRSYIRNKRLKSILVGNKYRIRREEWDKFLATLGTTEEKNEDQKE